MPTIIEQNLSQPRLFLTTAHILIGLSLIFIQIFHTSSVFETQTNFSRKNRLERQMNFRYEDAIYLYVYHTIAEAKDFRTGFEQIIRNNHTEYLHTVNSIERFSILPEIVIAYLYKQFIQLTTYYNIPTVSCYERLPDSETQLMDGNRIEVDDNDILYRHQLYYYYDQHTNIVCEGPGLPIFFYLEITWYLGGITLFSLYIFATYLSRNIFVGLYATLYYFVLHDTCTRTHSNPAARENFAFPFIIGQIYFLTHWIEQHNYRYKELDRRRAESSSNPESDDVEDTRKLLKMDRNEFKLGFFTAFAILCWDFSAYIFMAQILIVMLMVKMRLIKRRHIFLQNFILAHITARLMVNIVKYGWVEFHQKPMSFDCSALITLLLYIVQKYPTKGQRLRKIERIILRLFLLVMAVASVFELLSERNFYSMYADILLSKLYLKEPSFSAMLNMCRKEFSFVDSATLYGYNCLFISKFLVVFALTWSANWLKKRRNEEEIYRAERIQRAKNYLLEDYLEEKKLTMKDVANIEQNKEVKRHMALLESLDYNYERYKVERKKLVEPTKAQIERDAFLTEVRKIKRKISEMDNAASNGEIEVVADANADTQEHDDANEPPSSTSDAAQKEDSSKKTKNDKVSDNIPLYTFDLKSWQNLFVIERPEYFYNLLQTATFAILTVLILKVKFILSPFLCLIASTFPTSKWIPPNYSLWSIYVIIIGSCMLDRGVHNVRQQYTLQKTNDTAYVLEERNLYDMLKWIKSNTDRTAVFAGPDEIIGTVLLATNRPIANNPLNNHPEIRERSKAVHAMMSKMDSNSVYVQLAHLKIDYIIVSHKDCFPKSDKCKISSIWDIIQPENRNNHQLCAELFQRTNLNFLKVFVNENFMILKIFERFQVDLNMIQPKLQEKSM